MRNKQLIREILESNIKKSVRVGSWCKNRKNCYVVKVFLSKGLKNNVPMEEALFMRSLKKVTDVTEHKRFDLK